MRSQLVSLLAASPVALAYGGVGHRTIAYLAEKWLTPHAAHVFSELLANDRGYDFSDASTWADSIRGENSLPWNTGPWHYINNLEDNPPEGICGLNWPEDCPDEGCIVRAIVNQTEIVRRPTLDFILRKNATMFLIHFIGDLHQPLHTVGFDRGGTHTEPVCWDRPQAPCAGSLDLHAVWDRHIIHKQRGIKISLPGPQPKIVLAEKAAAAPWAEELFKKQKREGADIEGCLGESPEDKILEWAREVNVHACEAVYKPGVAWIKNNDLSEEYYEDNKKLVEDLVAKAGLRLGCWLNALAENLQPDSKLDGFKRLGQTDEL